MARVTDTEVKAIIDTDRDTTPFIDVATNVVDTHVAPEESDATILKQVELYLAAHFTAITEERGGLLRSDIGDETREIVSDVYDKGLSMTRYGQMAMTLDTTGALTDLNNKASGKPSANFEVV